MPKLMIAHFVLMTLAAISIIFAVVIARRKTVPWIPRHRRCAVTGALLACAGFGCIVLSKLSLHYPHFKSPHSFMGLTAILLLLVMPVLGMRLIKGNESLRGPHRRLGRVAALTVLAAAVMGAIRLSQILNG